MISLAAFRRAVIDCAKQAGQDAPTDTDLRLAVFVARLSGSMESLGDHELDAMLWGLFDHDQRALLRSDPTPQLAILRAA